MYSIQLQKAFWTIKINKKIVRKLEYMKILKLYFETGDSKNAREPG